VAAAAAVFALYSIVRHEVGWATGPDLANFDQAIWHLSRFEAPRISVFFHLPSVFGDHLHPVILLLVPLYWVSAEPSLLLAAQAVVVAGSTLPVFVFARRRLERGAAYLLSAAYLLFWGLHSGVAFDFHELAFAPLLIALAIERGDAGRLPAFFAVVAMLLAVKEDMALVVVALGVWLALRGSPRAGLACAALGAAWFALAMKVLLPAFAGGRGYQHWEYTPIGENLPDALRNLVTDPVDALQTLVTPGEKARTIGWLLAPFLGLVALSPLLVLAIPLVAERMFSANPNHWVTDYHYSMAIAPILAMGAADGLANLRVLAARRGREVPDRAVRAACAAMVLVSAVGAVRLAPLADLKNAGFYRMDRSTRVARDALTRLPAGASVAAQWQYMPHVSQREEIVGIVPGPSRPDYIAVNLADPKLPPFPSPTFAALRATVAAKEGDYERVTDEAGFVLLRRRAGVPESLRESDSYPLRE